MNLYLLLVALKIVNAGVYHDYYDPDTKCDGVIIDGHYHEKEILIRSVLGGRHRLAVDYNANKIYISYNYNINETTYKSAVVDLNAKKFKEITDVPDGFTQAVDQKTHNVYIGGDYGIYKYDHQNHKSELYAAVNKSIYHLFIKDVLYFSAWPSQIMYTYIDGKIERFKDMEDAKVRHFVIDSENVMFHSNDTGLYAQKKGGKDSYLYSNEFVNGLTLDVHGHAYMCTSDGIYEIDKMSMSLKKLICVNNCNGLAFDSDHNIIYADQNSLIRFKKIRKTC